MVMRYKYTRHYSERNKRYKYTEKNRTGRRVQEGGSTKKWLPEEMDS